jgi:ribonuclease R
VSVAAPLVAPRVAVLERRGKLLVAEPFFAPASRLAVARSTAYDAGDLVLLRTPRGRQRRERAQVARRIGRCDVARDVLEALLLDRGLRREFDPAVEHEARVSAERAIEAGSRRDLRALPTFTIDPQSARDYDDAISALPEAGGGWRVWVHIADVCAYVPPRSPLDREAHRRATSVYVPGKVEPMLPQALSNNACSLVPGVDRPTVSVEMLLEGSTVRSAAFHRSLIRSDARLTYEQVDRVFAGSERAEGAWGQALQGARAAAAALGDARAERGALEVTSAEPEFQFDRRGDVVGVRQVEQTESHRLIEQLMIAANEQVAQLLVRRGVPALYRVHERPEAVAVQRLVDQLASLGVPTPPVPKGHMTSQQAAELAGEASQLVAEWVARTGRGGAALTRLVLRSLKQAHYEERNLGHAGLSSPAYCHFTSPIRRYPDLICHRALLSALSGEEPAPERSFVSSAGPWCSSREREAMTIERDADDVVSCFLLERWLLEAGPEQAAFEGEVVGLIGAGAFVAFGSPGESALAPFVFEGLLPVRRLRGDWWELNEEGTILIGTRSGAAIRLGDRVRVRVERIDAPRGRVDLSPVQTED